MNGKQITRVGFIVLTLLIAVYDVIALTAWGVSATISRVIGVQASFDSPFVPFAVGMLMGHLFWPQGKKGELGE